MNYLILDDEPLAHKIIEAYAENLPFLTRAGNGYDAVSALDFLRKTPVDLLFLDIRMPKLTGFDLLRNLKQPPLVIVVSAHPEYALESYDWDVCDYLLKPFDFDRFLRAVNKARDQLEGKPTGSEESLFIKDGKKHHQVRLDEILFLEAQGNYSQVHHVNGTILASEKISELARRLPSVFLRVHKSYIVSKSKITLIEGECLMVGSARIPIGRVYKPNVAGLLPQS